MSRIGPTRLSTTAFVGASAELLIERLHQALMYARAASAAENPLSAKGARGKAESLAEWVVLQLHLHGLVFSDAERQRIQAGLDELLQETEAHGKAARAAPSRTEAAEDRPPAGSDS